MALPAYLATGGFLAKEILGEGLEATGRVAAATIGAVGNVVGSTIQSAGTALGGALQGAMTRPPVTIINNIGLAGQAGQQKIASGGGVIPPAPKKSAKPMVNASMPTEKLLVIAVNYLASIDKTLQAQLNIDRLIAQEELKTQKEAAIENKPAIGSDLISPKTQSNEKEAQQSSSLARNLILGTGLFGSLVLGLGVLNSGEEKLDELKANLSAFGEMLEEFAPIMNVLTGAYLGFKASRSPYGAVGGAILGLVYPELIDKLKSNFPSVFSTSNLVGLVTNPLPTIVGGVRTAYDFLTGNSSTSADATPANTTTTPDAVPNRSNNAANTNGQNKTITGVVEGGRGYTAVTYSDGTTERRTGTLPARTNNPGNIMYGDIARSYGAVGSSPSTNGPPVAVFPTPEAGFAAMDGLLTRQYSNGPIGQTIEAWATDPTHPAKVIGTAGIDPNKRYTDLTPEEKTRFMQALAKVEGFYAAGSGPTIQSSPFNSATNLFGSATDIAKVGLRTIGSFFRSAGTSLFGNRQYQSMEDQTSTAANLIRNMQPAADRSASISDASTRLESIMALGLQEDNTASMLSALPPGRSSLANVSQTGAIEAINPNYGGDDSVINYLQYYRLASAPAAVGAM